MRKKPNVLRSILIAAVLAVILFAGWDYGMYKDNKPPSFAMKLETETVTTYVGIGYSINDYHTPENGVEPYMTWKWFWQ